MTSQETVLASTAVLAVVVFLILRTRLDVVRRARRAANKLGDVLPAGGLAARADGSSVVTVEGVLAGSGVKTLHPYGAILMDTAHVYATTDNPPREVRVDVDGAGTVVLDGALQVVAGTRDTPSTDGEDGAFARTVAIGDRVRVRGVLHVAASTDETHAAGYRDRAAAFRMTPERDTRWAERPIPIVAVAPGARASVVRAAGAAAAVVAIASGGLALWLATHHTERPPGAAAVGARPRPACAKAIDDELDRGDTLAAERLLGSCDDPIGAGRVHWVLGDFAAAHDALARARKEGWDFEPTVAEYEAHDAAGAHDDARATAALMSDAWYRGPRTPEKALLDCAAGRSCQGEMPASSRFARRRTIDAFARGDHASFVSEYTDDPFQAVLYPDVYVNQRPVARELAILQRPGVVDEYAWMPEARQILSTLGVDVAVVAAHLGDVEKMRVALAPAAAMLAAYDASDAVEARAKAAYAAEYGSYGMTASELDQQWNEARYRRQLVYGGAAAAALLAGDEPTFARFEPYAEAHTRDYASRHRRLVKGERATTADWPHQDLFLLLDDSGGDGAVLAKHLGDAHFRNRVVFAELLPLVKKNREALLAWVEHAFAGPCVTCGLSRVAALTADRRAIAHMLGDDALAKRLTTACAGFEAALFRVDGATIREDLEAFDDRARGR